jgi:hypothetical protein
VVDEDGGGRCTFVVFEQLFEHSLRVAHEPPTARGRWRDVLDPVPSPAIVASVGTVGQGEMSWC